MNILKRDFLPDELEKELHQIDFSGSIAVQARQSIEETRWLLALSDQNKFIRGIVGWIDLTSHSVKEQLAEFSNHPKLVGVRHVVHDEPDDYFMLREDFLQGISLLKKYDLVYEILIFPKHLPAAIRLVKMFPEQTFILDHLAKPDIKSGTLGLWHEKIRELASFPNVSCKLSGMVTEANWQHWKKEDFHPFLKTVFSAFGTSRLLIGSDWPVCTVAGSYQDVMGIVLDYLDKMDQEDKEKVTGKNAQQLYSL